MSVTHIFSANTKIKSAGMNSNLDLVYTKEELNTQVRSSGGGATNTVLSTQLTQRGFFWVVGDDSVDIGYTVTFPVAYDDVEWDMFVTYVGNKATSAPSGRTQLTSLSLIGVNCSILPSARLASAAGVVLHVNDLAGSTFSSSSYYGFSWIAIGTKV